MFLHDFVHVLIDLCLLNELIPTLSVKLGVIPHCLFHQSLIHYKDEVRHLFVKDAIPSLCIHTLTGKGCNQPKHEYGHIHVEDV